MNRPGLIPLLCLLCATAHAQLTTASPAVQTACAQTASTPLPTDMANLATPTTYPKCDSYSLYNKREYTAARTCAIQERLALLARLPDSPAKAEPADAANDGADPAGGLVVLTQLYANATGVDRNPALAARFFCEAIDTNEVEHDPDPSSTKDILATLQRLRDITPASPHFDLCVTTGSDFPDNTQSDPPPDTPATRYCMRKKEQEWDSQYPAIHAGRMQAADDDAQKDAVDAAALLKPAIRKLTPTQRIAYQHLTTAFNTFLKKQITGIALFCPPYNGCSIPGTDELSNPEETAAFDTQLTVFLKTPPPIPAPTAVTASDAALNAVYRDLISAITLAAALPHSSVTPEMLRTEERAWVAYRDAFVAFGKTLYPSLPASAWLLPLTTARSSDLQQVYDFTGKQWIEDSQKHQQWQSDLIASHTAENASRRAEVAQYFDHQTTEQAAAWQQVQTALTAYAAAHAAAVPNPSPIFAAQQLDSLYGELYAFQYNDVHHQPLADPLKAEQAFAANEARVTANYQAALNSTCLFQPAPGDPPTLHRTPESLRAEQTAWLKLRDAWAAFLGTHFPNQPRPALSNMLTGERAFRLQMLTTICERTGRAPTEQ